jgi:hypothetical protein
MIWEKFVFEDVTQYITSGDEVANLEFFVWLEVPNTVLIQARKINTSWDENGFGTLSDFFEWSLNSVKNGLHNSYNKYSMVKKSFVLTWSKLNRQWISGSQNWVTIGKASFRIKSLG